jgi:hypothetical protein
VTPDTFLATALRPAFFLLPQRMNTPEACALLVAIALQESKLEKRWQMGKGPARSYFQFEKIGVRGVLKHKASAPHAKAVCGALDISASVPAVHRAIEFSDVLAVCFGRLLLWTLPLDLPTATQPSEGFTQYLAAWNPNRQKAMLRKAEWPGNFARAWALIRGSS